MSLTDRIDAELRPQRTLLGLRTFRQELLASNIANADTPNYKARDIDFSSAYAKAMQGQMQAGLALQRTDSKHIAAAGAGGYDNAVAYRTEFQSSVDGNTVNMDIERAAFAENAIQMEASLTFIRSRFQTLQSALQSN
jgi:flagellar basal-body rod protein FlgB